MTDENSGTVVREAFQKAEEYLKPQQITLIEPNTGVEAPAVLTGEGIMAVGDGVFDDYRTKPKDRADTATLRDLKSFIAYTNRFKDAESALFAINERSTPSITAVLDYHGAGGIEDETQRFGNHRAVHRFPLSDEWKVWTENDDKKMTMVEFAEFLENHIIDVLPVEMVTVETEDEEIRRFFAMMGGKAALADPARLMEIANNLQINESSHIKNAFKLSSGEATIEFQSEHETHTAQSGKITIPKLFAIGTPVFKAGVPYRIFSRFRYRKTGGGIQFFYKLWRTDRVFDHAFDEAIEKAASETGLPLFLGSDR